MDLLLQSGVSLDIGDATGKSPFLRAYQGKRDDFCTKLIEAGADPKNTVIDGESMVVKVVQDNRAKLAISWIKSGAQCDTRESNGMRSLIHIAAENHNWEILSILLDKGAKLFAFEDCHGASASCQSILVNLAKANQLQLLEMLLKSSSITHKGTCHMVINHWDIDCLLRLKRSDLVPLIQKFASEEFNWPPLENYTGGEAERLVERLKIHDIKFHDKYHDYKVRWNQPLPPQSEMERQWYEEKIWYRWEEKSAYEARSPITGIQVATDGRQKDVKCIKRIRFAYNHAFEEWRATSWTEGDKLWGEGGEEQDPFLLEEGEHFVEVVSYVTFTSGLSNLCGLELRTTSGRRLFWGKKTPFCTRSVTKETFLAYCSGGIMYGRFFSLTFHWEQNKPTLCAPIIPNT